MEACALTTAPSLLPSLCELDVNQLLTSFRVHRTYIIAKVIQFYGMFTSGWSECTSLNTLKLFYCIHQDFIESSDVHTLWGDVFLLVYAINDRSSFEELIPLRQHLEKVRAADKPLVVLIGNKKDTENDREVSTQEGLQFSKENNCSFYEISTKASYEDVENVFSEAIRDIARHKMTQRALNGVKQTSHNKIMEIVEKNVGRNRAMSSVKETIDEYCATRSEELSQDLSRDRRNTFT